MGRYLVRIEGALIMEQIRDIAGLEELPEIVKGKNTADDDGSTDDELTFCIVDSKIK